MGFASRGGGEEKKKIRFVKAKHAVQRRRKKGKIASGSRKGTRVGGGGAYRPWEGRNRLRSSGGKGREGTRDRVGHRGETGRSVRKGEGDVSSSKKVGTRPESTLWEEEDKAGILKKKRGWPNLSVRAKGGNQAKNVLSSTKKTVGDQTVV